MVFTRLAGRERGLCDHLLKACEAKLVTTEEGEHGA